MYFYSLLYLSWNVSSLMHPVENKAEKQTWHCVWTWDSVALCASTDQCIWSFSNWTHTLFHFHSSFFFLSRFYTWLIMLYSGIKFPASSLQTASGQSLRCCLEQMSKEIVQRNTIHSSLLKVLDPLQISLQHKASVKRRLMLLVLIELDIADICAVVQTQIQ